MTDRYAVFGNPVAHSKSPLIHSLFAKQATQDIDYTKQRVEPGQFESAARTFFDEGGKGLNVTVPFKLDAFRFAAETTMRAFQAGAVNTLVRQIDDTILGDNTDGIGLVRDITHNLQWSLIGKRILVIGAGGAVRGIVAPLLKEDPAAVVIANRTASKAHELAALFEHAALNGVGLDGMPASAFDLIINGSSASLANELPPLPNSIIGQQTACYDMVYGREPTLFLQWAKQQGCHCLADGLGMLVEQAAESFFIWRGIRPDTKPVISELRKQL